MQHESGQMHQAEGQKADKRIVLDPLRTDPDMHQKRAQRAKAKGRAANEARAHAEFRKGFEELMNAMASLALGRRAAACETLWPQDRGAPS